MMPAKCKEEKFHQNPQRGFFSPSHVLPKAVSGRQIGHKIIIIKKNAKSLNYNSENIYPKSSKEDQFTPVDPERSHGSHPE